MPGLALRRKSTGAGNPTRSPTCRRLRRSLQARASTGLHAGESTRRGPSCGPSLALRDPAALVGTQAGGNAPGLAREVGPGWGSVETGGKSTPSAQSLQPGKDQEHGPLGRSVFDWKIFGLSRAWSWCPAFGLSKRLLDLEQPLELLRGSEGGRKSDWRQDLSHGPMIGCWTGQRESHSVRPSRAPTFGSKCRGGLRRVRGRPLKGGPRRGPWPASYGFWRGPSGPSGPL